MFKDFAIKLAKEDIHEERTECDYNEFIQEFLHTYREEIEQAFNTYCSIYEKENIYNEI